MKIQITMSLMLLATAMGSFSANVLVAQAESQKKYGTVDANTVEQLDQLIRNKHVRPFWKGNRSQYEAVVNDVKLRFTSELNFEQKCTELLKMVAAIRDGHSGMAYESRDAVFGYIPLTVRWFGDELRIVSTIQQQEEALGAKIIDVEGTLVDQLRKTMTSVVPHANDQRFKRLMPSYLQLPGLLYGLGIAASSDQASFNVQLINGKAKKFTFKRMTEEQYKQAKFTSIDDAADQLPLCRQRREKNYWHCYLPDEKLFYLKYDRITSDSEKPIWTWAAQMWSEVDSLDVEKFVVDIRDNGGGGFQYSLPIVQGILDRPNINQRGTLFVLTGYRTFSAAIGFLEQLENRSQAIIVGEPPCDHPASPGDDDTFEIGGTGIKVNLSQIFHSTVFPEDKRTSVLLDQQIDTTWEQYASGADPLMNYVKKFEGSKKRDTPKDAFAWAGRYSYSADKVLNIATSSSGLQLSIGKFFSTPLYSVGNGRFKTEIVGFEVDLKNDDQLNLEFPDGSKKVVNRTAASNRTPLEHLYAGEFELAKSAYLKLRESDPNNNIVSDGEFSSAAILVYWDLKSKLGREEAKTYARKLLEIAIEILPSAPMSEYSIRFYQ